jgi:hypothetical protein
MWGAGSGGDPFFGASAVYGFNEGILAQKCFDLFASSSKYYCMLGGQYAWPGNNVDMEINCTANDGIAVAPYFGSLQTYNNDYEIFQPLFAKGTYDITYGFMKQHQDLLRSPLNVYEDNYHTTHGATEALRIMFTSCKAGAVAMPLVFLTYAKAFQLQYQCCFQLLQYSYNKTRIWGALVDMNTKRPTFLGLELANKAIAGDMIDCTVDNTDTWTQSAINGIGTPTVVKYIQSFAWKRDDGKYNFVVANLSLDNSYDVTFNIPGSVTVYGIQNDDIRDNNETIGDENVVIETIPYSGTLPLKPHSIYAIVAD